MLTMTSKLLFIAIVSAVLVLACARPNERRRESGSDGERRTDTDRNGRRVNTADDAMRFLKRFHWLDEMPTDSAAFTDGQNQRMPAQVTEAVRNYQRHNGLSETGELDDETMEVMSRARCGLPDDGMMERGKGRSRRFAIHGTKWPKTSLTYIFDNYTPDLSVAQTERTIRRAFDTFSALTPLRFTQVRSGRADINIRFSSGNHGDGSPFDGQGGVLAHAYYPQGGDAHFDEDETWTIGTFSGINLFQVAAHEFGHSLGLGHSDVRSALMYPTYRGYQPNFQLDSDDIAGIQTLYGPNTGNTPSPTTSTTTQPPTRPPTTRTPPPTTTTTTQPPTRPPTTRPPPPTTTTTSRPPTTTTTRRTTTPATPPTIRSTRPPATTTSTPTRPPTTTTRRSTRHMTTVSGGAASACDITKWDAVLTTLDGTVYFFAGSHYYRKGSPVARSIAADWGMSGPINAAFTLSSGYSVLFQDNLFRVFVNNRPIDNYFRYTRYYFPELPETPDAAWLYADSFIIATRGSRFWAEGTSYINQDFNRVFRGAPNSIDAATSVGRNPYFFHGQHYYVFSRYYWRVTGGGRSIARDFFGCPSAISEDESYFADLLAQETEPTTSEFEVEIQDKEKDVKLEEFMVKLNDEAGKVVDTDGMEVSSARACATWGVLTPMALALYWL